MTDAISTKPSQTLDKSTAELKPEIDRLLAQVSERKNHEQDACLAIDSSSKFMVMVFTEKDGPGLCRYGDRQVAKLGYVPWQAAEGLKQNFFKAQFKIEDAAFQSLLATFQSCSPTPSFEIGVPLLFEQIREIPGLNFIEHHEIREVGHLKPKSAKRK